MNRFFRSVSRMVKLAPVIAVSRSLFLAPHKDAALFVLSDTTDSSDSSDSWVIGASFYNRRMDGALLVSNGRDKLIKFPDGRQRNMTVTEEEELEIAFEKYRSDIGISSASMK